MNINKFFIVVTAQNQITMMKLLSENQNKLQEVTSHAIDEMTENSENILVKQKEILQVNNAHRAAVENNLHELMREKGLIRSGQIEVSKMILHLKEKLDESLVSLKQQSREMKQNQAALRDDLSDLQANAFHISNKLSETMAYVLSQNDIASSHFDRTIQHLSEISKTTEKLANLVQTLEINVDQKLAWISNKIGGSDKLLEKIHLLLLHMGYLLFGMLLLVFINASAFYRIFFIIAVPLNFVLILFECKHVNLIEITQILFIVYVTNFIRQLVKIFALNKKTKEHVNQSQNDEHKENRNYNEAFNKRETSQDREYRGSVENNNNYNYNHISAFKNRYMDHANRESSLTPSISSNRSLTPFSSVLQDRSRCSAYTMKGERCRNAAVLNQIYCRRHEK